MHGGSLLRGKTSNRELDPILAYLTPVITHSLMPCTDLSVWDATHTSLVKRSLRVFVPLFVRHHWVALDIFVPDARAVLYDSAPSTLVHQDIVAVFARALPEMRFVCGSSPQQLRGSDDCGLYMTLAFFVLAKNWNVNQAVLSDRTLPEKLRWLFRMHQTVTAFCSGRAWLRSWVSLLWKGAPPLMARD